MYNRPVFRRTPQGGPQLLRWATQDTAVSLKPAIRLEVELHGAGNGWTNLSRDVNLHAEPIAGEYGIRATGPLDRVAASGVMTWAMKNSDRSSGGVNGYYSPGHSHARVGWDIGRAVRLALVDSTTGLTHFKWRGTITDVEPDAGLYRRRAVHCVAKDWMEEPTVCHVKDTSVQTSKRADQLITTLIDNCVGRQPAARSLETCQSTFAYALDNMRDEKTATMRAIADAVFAEVGYFYQRGDTSQGGTVKLEDRHFRPKASSVLTLNDSMYDVVARRSRDDIYNHVIAIVHPRKIDAAATTLLYALPTDATTTKPFLDAGQTISFTVFYRDSTGQFVRVGGDSIVTPVATTDYLGNSQADGLGSDLTASLSITFASTSNSATITFTNTHASARIHVTKMQVRGKAVQDRYEQGVESANDTSMTDHGERDLIYDMIFEDQTVLAKGIADWIINLYGTARTHVSEIAIKANKSVALLSAAIAREPGDKITLTESMTGITGIGHFINGVRFVVTPGNLLTVNWILAPADQQLAWLLEDAVAGLLELSTYLGFA